MNHTTELRWITRFTSACDSLKNPLVETLQETRKSTQKWAQNQPEADNKSNRQLLTSTVHCSWTFSQSALFLPAHWWCRKFASFEQKALRQLDWGPTHRQVFCASAEWIWKKCHTLTKIAVGPAQCFVINSLVLFSEYQRSLKQKHQTSNSKSN